MCRKKLVGGGTRVFLGWDQHDVHCFAPPPLCPPPLTLPGICTRNIFMSFLTKKDDPRTAVGGNQKRTIVQIVRKKDEDED